jgi:hypothetical protein
LAAAKRYLTVREVNVVKALLIPVQSVASEMRRENAITPELVAFVGRDHLKIGSRWMVRRLLAIDSRAVLKDCLIGFPCYCDNAK